MLRHSRSLRSSRLATALLTLLAPGLLAAQELPVLPDDPAQLGDLLESHYDRLEQSLRTMPQDGFSPLAVLETVGRDPQALLAWVRDETDLLPYRGALRGPRGVLMDRAGNSLDRALLLAELLRLSGHEVRLANAQLSSPQAQELVSGIGDTRRHYPSAEATDAEAAAFRQQVDRHAAALLEQVSPAMRPADTRATWPELLADHWWVERNENGQWIAMDPTLEGGTPTAGRTVAYTGTDGRIPLEDADVHVVNVRVVIEAFKEGKLASETVLEQALRPAELIDRRISLAHYGGKSVGMALMADDPQMAEPLKKVVLEQEKWIPVLTVGGDPHFLASFDTAGNVDRDPAVDGAGQLGAAMGQTMGGMFGGLTGGGDESAEDNDVLTAEWIEYEIRVPGEAPQTVRRMIFDLIGPAARAAESMQAPAFGEKEKLTRGLMLAGQTQIVLQVCELTPEFLVHEQVKTELADRDVWLSLARDEFPTPADWLNKVQQLKADADSAGYVAAARAVVSPEAGNVFIDRPNVVQYRLWGEIGADGNPHPLQGIDLAFTSTASLDATAGDAFAARLRQGVADTLAEQMGFRDVPDSTENTISIHEKAGTATLARTADELAALSLPTDVHARAAADLATGSTIVLAKLDTGRAGWWRIDPATGQTVGVMDNGYHNDTSEYPATVQKKIWLDRANFWKKKLGADKFKQLSASDWMKLTNNKSTLWMDEWEIILQLQGKLFKTAGAQIAAGLMGHIMG